MIWPFGKTEYRADSSYTDALVAAITANAAGRNTAFPTATSALESCAGFVGRAFASAEVKSPPMFAEALSPSCMALIGRALIRRGEVVFLISAAGGRLSLLPCESHDIDGGPDPATWWYRCTVGGPERTLTWDHVPAEGVIHLTYARDPERHWRGYGPLQVAQLAGRLSASTSQALANEAGRPHGSFLPLPNPDVAETVNARIKTAKGAVLGVEAGDWDIEQNGQNAARFVEKRFGADPPDALVKLHERAFDEIVGACGLMGLFSPRTDGTGRREAYRQALHSVIAPLGRLVAAELTRKLETPIRLDWQELKAGDIAGRSRAFASLVNGGMDMQAAAAASGVLLTEAP